MSAENKTRVVPAKEDFSALTPKKFRQTPEIEGFYRFVYENDLQKESLEVLERIIRKRKVAAPKKTKKIEESKTAQIKAKNPNPKKKK